MYTLSKPTVHGSVLGLARAHMVQSLSPGMCIGSASDTEEKGRGFSSDQPSEEFMCWMYALGHLVLATTLGGGNFGARGPCDGATA